jgi:hypothetical protein
MKLLAIRLECLRTAAFFDDEDIVATKGEQSA